ncbi:MAG: hypothetical protein K2X86_00040 [Cytophagaceae bacterium]|nr:hypothetical protein [Cytophagaceae bacterium]
MSQQALSPEKYIRTKARTLPIETCLLNAGWSDHGLAVITVIRRHPKGSVTAGVFMVDIFCLGVKDCYSLFNVHEDKLWEALDNIYTEGSLEADYAYVHNIIFNAVDFARSFNVSPHKDFSLCQYILEPEDSIEFIETPVGDKEEKPLFLTSYDYPHNSSVIHKLKKHFGEGGFKVVYRDDLESDDDNDIYNEYEEEEENPDDFELGYSTEDIAIINEKFSRHYKYSDSFDDKIKNLRQFIEKLNTIEYGPAPESAIPRDILEELEMLKVLTERHYENINYEKAWPIIESLISRYPHIEELYYICLEICSACWYDERAKENGDKICTEMLKRFPRSFRAKIKAGIYYDNKGMEDEFKLLWGNDISLKPALMQFNACYVSDVARIAILFMDHLTSENEKIEEAEIIFQALKDLDWFAEYKDEAEDILTVAKDDYLWEQGIEL